jgi:hypothetical protein
MATIEILGWKDKDNFISLPDADRRKSELKEWLRRGVKASPGEIRRLARQITARELVSLQNVYDEAVYKLTNILQATGAEIRVSLDFKNSERFFKNCPPR